MSVTLVNSDPRGRVSVGHPDQSYRMTECPDGTLVLEPAVVLSELERKFMEDTLLQAQISYFHDHPDELVASERRRARATR